jgi:dTMP kinase
MFITLEGIEGSGKTTQLKNITAYLDRKGYDTIITREPGGTVIGEKIRAILLDPVSEGMEPLAELFLYEADRVEHIKKKIIPALAAGKTVLCDRFYDATVVYQGYARGLDLDFIQRVHCLILEDLKPDLTLLFDLKPQIGLSRAWDQINNGRRTGDESRFEKETLAFHEKIRAGYLELARLEPERFHIIDASRDLACVKGDTISRLEQALKQKRY